ncbi:hypothetical protein PHET_04785 [Paragonimus heterotremus]|uniref:Uncharacterized protein n=1 Tax=Paragonimus heterotremus TaxID=100268 RepID=A0A8J4WRN5_9TREM|nr:hypothetical protein PHET_04785 [Paragonimus heterotremus]
MLDETYNEEVDAQESFLNLATELKLKIKEPEPEVGLSHGQFQEMFSLVLTEKVSLDIFKVFDEKAQSTVQTNVKRRISWLPESTVNSQNKLTL